MLILMFLGIACSRNPTGVDDLFPELRTEVVQEYHIVGKLIVGQDKVKRMSMEAYDEMNKYFHICSSE